MNTFLRWLGIIICAIPMLGFGICGAWGVLGGAFTLNSGTLLFMILPGVTGLAIAYGCYRIIRALLKPAAAEQAERTD